MKTIYKIIFLTSLIFFTSCKDIFDYSAYVIDFDSENKNVNNTNIEKLSKKHADSTIRIAFTGDTHRYFDEFQGFVDAANKENEINPFDFVIHVGDIADFGIPQQYLWGNSYLLDLKCPYFVVIGNHDLVGNGQEAYREMFGDFDFSFIYKEVKFVFLNTNSMEFSFNGQVPNLEWLDEQLKPAKDFKNAVVIFHVPPEDDSFDSDLETNFHNVLAKYQNVLFTVHGHLHHHEIYVPYSDGITYVNVYGVENRKFNVIEITDDKFEVSTYEF